MSSQTFRWQRPVKYGEKGEVTHRKDFLLHVEGSEEAIYELAALPTVEAVSDVPPKATQRTRCTTPGGHEYVITYFKGVGRQYAAG